MAKISKSGTLVNKTLFLYRYNRYYEKVGNSEPKCIDDELPFEIPDSWQWARLCNFAISIFSGKSPKYSKEATQHKVIGQQANQWGGIDLQYIKYCTNDFAVDMPNYYYLQDGDILLNTLGNGTLGRSGYFDKSLCADPILTDGHLFVFRNYNKDLSKFLRIYLRIKYDEIVRSANGSTNQTFLNLTQTSQWLIPVPTLNEIKKIVAEIDKYEPLILEYDQLDQAKSKLDGEIYDNLKKSILQYAIQGKLVSQDPNDEPASVLLERIRAEKKAKLGKKNVDSYIYKGDDNCYYEKIDASVKNITDEIPFEIPETWEWVRLGTIFQHNTGKALNSSNTKGIMQQYITTSNLYWGYFKLDKLREMLFTEEETKKCSVQKGDLLVCEGGDIGRAAIWDYDYSMCIQNHIHKLRPILPVNIYFYYYVFLIYKNSGLIGGKGIGIQGLSSNALDQLIIPLPPMQEQNRIIYEINRIIRNLKDED